MDEGLGNQGLYKSEVATVVGYAIWRFKQDYNRVQNHCNNTKIHLTERYLKLSEARENEQAKYLTELIDAQHEECQG